jgi:ABC-type transport system involved in cytochrome bd biosynthesis fused ATPase/permease subunit
VADKQKTELLDSFASPSSSPLVGTVDTTNIGISHTAFSFSSAAPESAFKLSIDRELLFSPGCTTLIAGPTGCGKTALLLALLGEMHATPTGSGESWASLDRKNGVAYAAQEGWLMSATVRENVIYGSAFDEPRYRAGEFNSTPNTTSGTVTQHRL